MKNMLSGLFTKPKAKTARPDAKLRHSIELARRDQEEEDYNTLSEDLQKTVGFTVEEKRDFFYCRMLMGWMPTTGPNGGFYQKIATRATATTGLTCSRQYVQQSLFPENPDQLFRGRAPLYKTIWTELKKVVDEAMADPKSSAYAHIMNHLHNGRMVWVQNMRSSRLDILRKKIVRTAGFYKVMAYRLAGKIPYDFLFVPEPGVASLVVQDTSEEVRDMIIRKLPMEIFGFNRLVIDNMFPDPAYIKERRGVNHYLVRAAEPLELPQDRAA